MDRLLIDIPEKGTYKIKSKNGLKEYVYLTTKAYRNEKGKPTSDSVMIGIVDVSSNKMIPNDNFFKYFECKINIEFVGEKNDI